MAGTRTTAPAQLSALELATWTGLLRAHSTLTRRLDRELEAECGLSLAQYDVLVTIAHAPNRHLRMTELADAVVLSRSGLTRLVDRLESLDLVARQSCPTDARVTHATLTKEGLTALRNATPVHLRGVRQHVTGRLSAAEQRSVADAMARLLRDD